MKVIVVTTNCLENSKVEVKDDARWNSNENCLEVAQCSGVNVEKADELGRLKNHFVPTEDVGKRN